MSSRAHEFQQFSFWHPPAFGVHALACLGATDTLKRELQTRLQPHNENCVADCDAGRILGEKPYEYEGPAVNPYVQEHVDLIRSIRAGTPLNEGQRMHPGAMRWCRVALPRERSAAESRRAPPPATLSARAESNATRGEILEWSCDAFHQTIYWVPQSVRKVHWECLNMA